MAQGISGAFDRPFLTQEQQALGRETFESAAKPLEEAFGRQREQQEELLAQRGVQFGGLGSQSRERLQTAQSQVLGGLASQISTSLGKSALDQAFASSEAAKSRQFGAEQAKLGREFGATEAEKGRQFGREQSLFGLGLSGALSGDALNAAFEPFGIDPSTVRIDGQSIEEFQSAQKSLTDKELESALRDRTDVLREELVFNMLGAGVHPNDIPKKLAQIEKSLGDIGLSEGLTPELLEQAQQQFGGGVFS